MCADFPPITHLVPTTGYDALMTPLSLGGSYEGLDRTVYSDCTRWRDPMPPLPQTLPYALRLDRRLRPNPLEPRTAAGAAIERLGRTDVVEHARQFRTCYYLDPSRDLVAAVTRLFIALPSCPKPPPLLAASGAGKDTAVAFGAEAESFGEDVAPLNPRGGHVHELFFHAIGNPPLAGKELSRQFVGQLLERGYLDAQHRPNAALTRAEVYALASRCADMPDGVAGRFATAATLALNVVYDICRYGITEVRAALLPDAPDPWPQLTWLHITDKASLPPARAKQVRAMMDELWQAYCDALLEQALDAACVRDQTGVRG